MEPRSHYPETDGLWPELPDVLREAIRQAREAPVPLDVQHRALERARQIGRPSRSSPQCGGSSWRVWLCVGGIAAVLFISLVLWPGRFPTGGYPDTDRDNIPRLRGPGDDRPTLKDVVAISRPRRSMRSWRGDFCDLQSDSLPIGLAPLSGDRDEEQRLEALRDLSSGMTVVDRKGMDAYLRHMSGPAWHNGARPLAQARVRAADGQTVTLLGVSVQVVIEGPRARTLVDNIFRNQNARPVSGTFECSLPEGASPCYFALFPGQSAGDAGRNSPAVGVPHPPTLPDPGQFVRRISRQCWGTPRIARVIRIERRSQGAAKAPSDAPARAVSATCFRGPVGKVEVGGFRRVVLAYEQVLPWRDGRVEYRYSLPTEKIAEFSFTLQTATRLAKQGELTLPGLGAASRQEVDGKAICTGRWRNSTAEGEICFKATPPDATVQATSGRRGERGPYYLFARLSPTVPASVQRSAAPLVVRRLRFVAGPAARDLHFVGPPGGELLLAARFARPGATRLVLEAEQDGKKLKQEFSMNVEDGGQLAARGWAELAVDELVTANDPEREPLAVALGQQFGVASRNTTFAMRAP